MIYRLCVGAVLALTAPTLQARSNDDDVIQVPGAELTVNLADVRSQTKAAAPLTAIETWLVANFELPPSSKKANIEFASPVTMTALRFGGLPTATGHQALSAEQARVLRPDDTVAVYVDATNTIYLPTDWTGRTPAELSVLVHGLVHHLQNSAGTKYACQQEREQLAYAAQDRWLGLFGKSLPDEFGIDPFTLLVRTRCIY